MLPPPAPLAFHRLVLARRRSQWWTPLLVGLLGAVFYVVASVVLVLVAFALAIIVQGTSFVMPPLDEASLFDITNPGLIAVVLLSVALMLPSYVAASAIINGPRLGLTASVVGRLRGRWLLLCLGVSVVAAALMIGASFLLPAVQTTAADQAGIITPAENPQVWVTLAVIVVVVPFQAAAEEFVFRGYLMQAVGRWLRHPAWAIVLPVPLFVLGHTYDPLGQTAVGLFALAAGWLTWRTGGLEAAIALHIVNNVVAFGLALAGAADANAKDSSLESLVASTLMIGVYVLAVEWLYRRRQARGLQAGAV